ncbi:amidohydrolase family protein [Actinomadura madurae]|uniref:amidohydrolase family protein n=1 Tax=Actinomadura madurae TaxID=1993 RepID=UPI0020264491|nr:amidohydrolase family protein [Actinomadura madurae]MCP9948491.1 amidohydrolase [Actinomadura madurae]MCP9965271.1 amidohydrolase [Actinomadura madurae]MCP9977761.1 amidohydrolase [Actinomadura madurae]MCQ0010746.1 amidohydrolase [Actinomadura madurae]MCQ0013948.1 amidohydrolase [Actinomadura madurae]
MRFFHVPDLNGIGSATFEERESSRLRQSVEGGACGIKVWKNLGLWQRDVDGELLRVSDGRLGWLWRRAADLGLPVAIHVGDAEAFFEPLDERNERIEELERHPDYWFGDRSKYPPLESIHEDLVQVIADNPETRFVAVHFGCFIQFERLHALLMRFPNLSVDTAARIADLGRERDRDAVLRIFHDHGDRVVFGTDIIRCTRECMPDVTPEDPYLRGYFQLHFDFFQSDEPVPSPLPFQGSWPVRGLGLDGGVTERLFYENAARLLRLG